MFDLDRQSIEFPCPRCHFYNSAFLRQVRLRQVVICRGCKSNLRLDDHMNEYRKAERQLRRAFGDLELALSKLSRG
jgi:transcription initiation factor IIE alpha subunit